MKINIITGMILAALCLLLFAGTVAHAFAGPLPSTGGHPLVSSLSNAQGELASSAPARPHDSPDVRHPSTWWDEDVWADPDRPFLYYGDNEVPDMRPGSTVEPPEPQSVVKPDEKPFDPEDFTAFKTVEDLRAERERRLNTAIMNPSPANMQSYQAINAHLLALSARFAQAWQLGRMQNPGYDWTTTAPSANFATVELGAMKRDKSHALVKSLQGDLQAETGIRSVLERAFGGALTYSSPQEIYNTLNERSTNDPKLKQTLTELGSVAHSGMSEDEIMNNFKNRR